MAAANNQLTMRIAGSDIKVQQAERAAADARQSMEEAQRVAAEHEGHIASLKTTISEQSSMLGRQHHQVRGEPGRGWHTSLACHWQLGVWQLVVQAGLSCRTPHRRDAAVTPGLGPDMCRHVSEVFLPREL